MVKVFKTIDGQLETLEKIENGAWINIIKPSKKEIDDICEKFSLDINHVIAALDEEERARIEIDDNCILILIDVPIDENNESNCKYTTIPLGIILVGDNIITICTTEVPLLKDFILGRIKSFYTFKKTRFILQMLYKNATYYLQYLRHINRMSDKIEGELHKSTKNKELFELLALEKSLVYFSTSLRGNEIVLEKMLRIDAIKKYQEDTDLLEDVIIENKQAIEMAKIYSDILGGIMDVFASIISNNLNIVMKFLTSVTIVMAIPTMVSSMFGMNVAVPLANNTHAFTIIILLSFAISLALTIIMMKKKLF